MSTLPSKYLILSISLVLLSCHSKNNYEDEKSVNINNALVPLNNLPDKEKVLQLNFPNRYKELRFILNDDREL